MLKTENAYGLNAVQNNVLNKITHTAIPTNSTACSPTQSKLASVTNHSRGGFLSRSICMRISLHQANSSGDEPASPTTAEPVYEISLLKKFGNSHVENFSKSLFWLLKIRFN